MASEEAESYYACPYCLTEIVLEENVPIEEKEQESEVKETKIKESNISFADERSVQTQPKVENCTRFFGYLSQRSSKEKIPEECIVCENIVQCMLKKVTG